jgi:ribonuclease J
VGDVGHGVIRDRQVLAEEGVVVVIVTVDHDSAEIITGPEVITRGWIYADEAEDLLEEMRNLIADAVMVALEKGDHDSETLQRVVRKKAGKFVSDRTKRRPMIVPVVMSL